MEADTPLYGGSTDINIRSDKSITKGDSCNTSILEFPSHVGTHVDVPYHFVEQGRSVDMYQPGEFIFNHPFIVNVKVESGQLILPEDIQTQIPATTDLILIKTGFESHRKKEVYWQASPGLSHELADAFLNKCPALKAIGMDFISISSLKHREEGRKAHKAFLSKQVLLIEDMKLSVLDSGIILNTVMVMPLRVLGGDGAPCTIIGFKD